MESGRETFSGPRRRRGRPLRGRDAGTEVGKVGTGRISSAMWLLLWKHTQSVLIFPISFTLNLWIIVFGVAAKGKRRSWLMQSGEHHGVRKNFQVSHIHDFVCRAALAPRIDLQTVSLNSGFYLLCRENWRRLVFSSSIIINEGLVKGSMDCTYITLFFATFMVPQSASQIRLI